MRDLALQPRHRFRDRPRHKQMMFPPYIYLSLVFVFISFLLHLGIFYLLLKNKTNIFT